MHLDVDAAGEASWFCGSPCAGKLCRWHTQPLVWGTRKAVFQNVPVAFWSRMLVSAFAFCFLLGIMWSLGWSGGFQL